MLEKQSHLRHYLVILTGMMVMFTCSGTAYGTGGLFIASVTRALGVGKAEIALYLTIGLGVSFFLLPFAGRLVGKRDLRLALSIGPVCFFLAQMIFSFANRVWVFYAGGVVLGLGMSFTNYLTVPTLVTRWFRTRIGAMIGIGMMMTGVGGVVWNQVAGYVIGNFGWQMGYRVLAFAPLVLALPLTLFAIRSYPTDIGLRQYGDTGQVPAADLDASLTGVSASAAMKSAPFYLMFAYALLVCVGCQVLQYLPSYALTLPISKTMTTVAAVIASFAAFGQALGKVTLGGVADRNVYGAVYLSAGCGLLSILLLWLVPTSPVLIFGPAVLMGFMFAASGVLLPILVRTAFGVREYPQIWSRVSTATALAGATSVTLVGGLIDLTGGFTAVWILGLVVAIASALVGTLALKGSEKLEHVKATVAEAVARSR